MTILKSKTLQIFSIFLIFFSFSYGQSLNYNSGLLFNQNDKTIWESVKSDVNIGLEDGYHIFTSPAHFSKNTWLIAGGIIGGTALSFLADKDIRNWSQRNHTNTLDNVTKAGEDYGKVVYAASISLAIYAGGRIFKNEDLAVTGRMLGETLIFAGIITSVLKSAFGRARPYKNEGNTHFIGLQFKTDNTSFPSGHTTVAFSMSTILASRIDNPFASIGLYSLAGLTMFQRIYGDRHWFSDTLLGAAIGTAVGRAVIYFNDKREGSLANLSFMPTYSKSGFGFSLVYNF